MVVVQEVVVDEREVEGSRLPLGHQLIQGLEGRGQHKLDLEKFSVVHVEI